MILEPEQVRVDPLAVRSLIPEPEREGGHQGNVVHQEEPAGRENASSCWAASYLTKSNLRIQAMI